MQTNKTAFIILGVTFVILSVILGGYFLYKSRNKVASSLSTAQPTAAPEEELTTWNDQAEFSFQYPKSLNLNPHEEDEENYARVELTSDKYSGSLIVWVKDTTAKIIEDWVKQMKLTGGIDSSLDGEKAIKILTTDEPNKLTISSIRNGYLYQIEVTLTDKEYWQKIYETVNSSFKFTDGNQDTSKEAPTNQNNSKILEDDSGNNQDENTIDTSGDEIIE